MDARIRGRFESGGPITTCGQVRDDWTGPDGTLVRLPMDLCGDDLAALAQTVRDNLDAIALRNGQALVMIAQGTNLPDGWLADCTTWTLDSGNFSGPICLPWDAQYQAHLDTALTDHLGPALSGHPALAGVYLTTPTMTNGAEMHFRVDRSTFPDPPTPTGLTDAYLAIMDRYQAAFDVPIVFEGGHCLFDAPGVDETTVDCETPLALYRHARDTYGRDATGVALWNCAERFWHGPDASEHGIRPLLEEVTTDGASLGCQTVGNFTEQPCRFSDPAVGDYGTADGIGRNLTCTPAGPDDAERACVDTLNWFTGTSSRSATSVQLQGTWLEGWTADVRSTGVLSTDADCAAAAAPLAR